MRVAADLGLKLQGSFRSSMAQARCCYDDPGSSFRAPFGAAWLKRGVDSFERLRRRDVALMRVVGGTNTKERTA